MKQVSIWQRILPSVIDKVIIMVLFVVIAIAIAPYATPGALGLYTIMLSDHASLYGHYREGYESATNIDLNITTTFVIVNFFYYLIGEVLLKASLGKRMFGYTYLVGEKKMNIDVILKRNLLFLLLMSSAVIFRFMFDTNYYIAIALFFVLLDGPVLVSKNNLIDLITDTSLYKK